VAARGSNHSSVSRAGLLGATLSAVLLLVACAESSSRVSRLVVTNDTSFVASARPVPPPPSVRCLETAKKPAGKARCKREHWFRWRIENVGTNNAFALCHLQAFAGTTPVTPNREWLPWAGRNEIKAGHVDTRTDMTPIRTTQRVTRYVLRCHAARWTNGAPV
jgi:hypothetical protein